MIAIPYTRKQFWLLVSDFDECNTVGHNNCDVNAICENTVGGFTCTCNTGYNGDGVSCDGR